MGIQTIINSAQSIEIDRRKIVGQTISRSERLRIAERASANAFTIRVSPVARFKYSETRGLLESIQFYDRYQEQIIGFASNPKLNYINRYQGSCTAGQLAAMTITNFSSSTVTVGSLPSIGSSNYVFKAGDWIQPETSRYPYIVVTDVLRGSTTTVQVNVHRPLITSENITVTGPLLVGTQTTLRMVVTELPTYKIIQNNWAEFTGDFNLIERII